MVKDINRSSGPDWTCKCGKEATIHTTRYPDADTCEHLYFCWECWWTYDKQPRKLSVREIEQKQKDIADWRRRTGYDY